MAFLAYHIAIVLAVIGFALMLWGGWLLVRRWSRMRGAARWAWLVLLALFEVAYWANIYAWFIEPRMLVVQRVEVVSEHWQGGPLTIAVLSDTHVPSPHMSVTRMGNIVARVNRLRPDLVVLLGDYVGGHGEAARRSPEVQNEVAAGIATFAAFNAPLGAVAVIGNHDVWYNRANVTRALEEAGVAALWDRNVTISRPTGDLAIVGLADGVTAHANFEAAADGAPANADMIVLAHTPDAFFDIPRGQPSLLLAGHTHCGQVTIPFIGRPMLPIWNRQYACHRVDEPENNRTVYVTGGLGTSTWPVRFLNPPEIVLIKIRALNSIDLQSPSVVRG
jgi:predicted MPP superfamily phosphohydrolase